MKKSLNFVTFRLEDAPVNFKFAHGCRVSVDGDKVTFCWAVNTWEANEDFVKFVRNLKHFEVMRLYYENGRIVNDTTFEI